MLKHEVDILYEIHEIIAVKDKEKLNKLFEHTHVVDIAEILSSLSEDDRINVFRILDSEKAAEILNELDNVMISPILEALDSVHTSEILEEIPLDDAADILGELSETEKNRLLDLMEVEDAEDVQELLDYPEDTAGGIMTTEFVAIRKDITTDRAIQVLRELASEVETIYYVYVIDDFNRLVGVISLRELIINNPFALIEDIMHTNVKSVNVKSDQEEVARLVAKYDILAIPVTDDKRELLGIITVDDVIDVIQEEATEDIYRLAGTSEVDDSEILSKGVYYSVRSRLPWLLITLAGGVISGSVIRAFEDILSAVLSLVTFLPVVSGMGGNVGTQSSTITVRGIATGTINSKNVVKTIFKEAMVGLVLGIICGSILALIADYWRHKPVLGLVVGAALWGNMLVAATIGTLVPLFFKRIGVDPAIASAPFISTTVDITGYLISFTLTKILLGILT